METMNVNCTLNLQTKAINWALFKFTTNEFFCNKNNKHSPQVNTKGTSHIPKHWKTWNYVQIMHYSSQGLNNPRGYASPNIFRCFKDDY